MTIIIFYSKVLLVIYEQKLYKMYICKTPIFKRVKSHSLKTKDFDINFLY